MEGSVPSVTRPVFELHRHSSVRLGNWWRYPIPSWASKEEALDLDLSNETIQSKTKYSDFAVVYQLRSSALLCIHVAYVNQSALTWQSLLQVRVQFYKIICSSYRHVAVNPVRNDKPMPISKRGYNYGLFESIALCAARASACSFISSWNMKIIDLSSGYPVDNDTPASTTELSPHNVQDTSGMNINSKAYE